MLNPAKSMTHAHLLSVVNTESCRFPAGEVVSVLDMGCGDGHLIGYLSQNLPVLNPPVTYEIFGFDVGDHGVQRANFLDATIETLSVQFPGIAWRERVVSISTNDTWPYPDEFFDIVLSNQVLEHIADHDMVFSEIYRTLRYGGFSVHLFPLKNCLYESHLHLPLAHKIVNFDLSISYIKLLSRLGLGKFKGSSVDLDTFTEQNADYMHFFTNYLSYGEALRLAKKHRLRVSFRYTREFYARKLRSILSLKNDYMYSKNRAGFIDWLSIMILRYVSSITLFLEKRETYTGKISTNWTHPGR